MEGFALPHKDPVFLILFWSLCLNFPLSYLYRSIFHLSFKGYLKCHFIHLAGCDLWTSDSHWAFFKTSSSDWDVNSGLKFFSALLPLPHSSIFPWTAHFLLSGNMTLWISCPIACNTWQDNFCLCVGRTRKQIIAPWTWVLGLIIVHNSRSLSQCLAHCKYLVVSLMHWIY